MRQQQLARQWQILAELASARAGLTVRRLAERLGLHGRTLYRDLTTLSMLGFPIVQESRNGSVLYRWAGPRVESMVAVSPREWLAVALAAQQLRVRGLFELATALRRLSARALGSDAAKAPFDAVADALARRSSAPLDVEQHLEILLRAAAEKKACSLTYHSTVDTAPRSRKVHPLCVFYEGDSSYLAAFSPDHAEVRLYKLARILDVTSTEATFVAPREFSLDRYMEGAFRVMRSGAREQVVLRFASELARYIGEASWPPGVVQENLRTGSVRVTMNVLVTPEIEAWILSFGEKVQVLAPNSLQEGLARRLEASLAAMLRVGREPAGQLRLFSLAAYSAVEDP